MKYTMRTETAFESFERTPTTRDRCAHCEGGFELGQRTASRVVSLPDEVERYEHYHAACYAVSTTEAPCSTERAA